MSSASRYWRIEARQYTPRSIPSCVSRTSWYGPAHSAVTYVLIRTDGAKCTVFVPSISPGPTEATPALETTVQCAGTVACQVNADLRSGWSKQAYAFCASAVSNWL